MTYDDLKNLMRPVLTTAARKRENLHRTGHVNWSYVDADVYMELKEEINQYSGEYVHIFDELANEFEYDYVSRLVQLSMHIPSSPTEIH